MMTTGKVFDIQPNRNPFYGGEPPQQAPAPEPVVLEAPKPSKEEVLQGYIEKFLAGEITEKQLAVIKKTLE